LLTNVDEISKACYDEFQYVTQGMQPVDIENFLRFSDVDMCKKLDTFCPVLSSALKGAKGWRNRKESGESPSDHAIRTMCYGALFKARSASLYFFEFISFLVC